LVLAQRAAALSPDDAGTHLLLGDIYSRSANWRAAEGAFSEAARLRPGHITVMQRLQKCRANLRQHETDSRGPPPTTR
jgi:cytochrome c-type biogenesis protein CcmH/NrfG